MWVYFFLEKSHIYPTDLDVFLKLYMMGYEGIYIKSNLATRYITYETRCVFYQENLWYEPVTKLWYLHIRDLIFPSTYNNYEWSQAARAECSLYIADM